MAGTGRTSAIISYNGMDGACAAAAALLRFPKADLWISSASSIGRTFASILKREPLPGEIHVCGVGVYCDWDEVVKPAKALEQKGCRIYWYCGRGYLEKDRAQYEQFSTPVFVKAKSNTEAVCKGLHLEEYTRAGALVMLAEHDVALGADHEPDEDESRWRDLLLAAGATYFKYQDTKAYMQSIKKLAEGVMDKNDERAIKVFRATGYKYVLTGSSPQLRALRQAILKCAVVDEPVLVTGETGVGKEHVAHLIYEGGQRATGPFVSVNCAVFAGNAGLANSILFGHLQGAFTGAMKKRDGAFLSADGGVLFLDEVGELPPEVQPKFLRVLDDGEIVPEGADKPIQRVSVRVVAATNRDLGSMIRKGQFRADLFHRLATLRIDAPPLRERKEDIEAIVEQTLGELPPAARSRKLKPRELDLLRSYDWPGNVRQLIGLLKRCVYQDIPIADALKEEKSFRSTADQSEDEAPAFLPAVPSEVKQLRDIERAYAAHVWELHEKNFTATAKALGIAVNTLRSLMARQ